MYTAALSLLLVYSSWSSSGSVEPCGETQQLAQRAADAMNYAQYWKAGAENAARKHNTHIEKCNRVIEAGESGLPAVTPPKAAPRQQVEGKRVEVLNLTSRTSGYAMIWTKVDGVADLSVRVDDATKKIGSGNGSGMAPGWRELGSGRHPCGQNQPFGRDLRTVRLENERLKGAWSGHADLGIRLREHLDAAGREKSAGPGTV
jgi:hypothetical protein